jgi:hypothetical protein
MMSAIDCTSAGTSRCSVARVWGSDEKVTVIRRATLEEGKR